MGGLLFGTYTGELLGISSAPCVFGRYGGMPLYLLLPAYKEHLRDAQAAKAGSGVFQLH